MLINFNLVQYIKQVKFATIIFCVAFVSILTINCKKEPRYPAPRTIHYTGVVVDGHRKPLNGAKVTIGEGMDYKSGKLVVGYTDSLGRYSIFYHDEYPWADERYDEIRKAGYNSAHVNDFVCSKENYSSVGFSEDYFFDTAVLSQVSYVKVILKPTKTAADGIYLSMTGGCSYLIYHANPYGQNQSYDNCRAENPRDNEFLLRSCRNYRVIVSGKIYPGGYCKYKEFSDTIYTGYTYKDTVEYVIEY